MSLPPREFLIATAGAAAEAEVNKHHGQLFYVVLVLGIM
jgi:hypothetical protein